MTIFGVRFEEVNGIFQAPVMLSNKQIQELFDAIFQLHSKITLKILHIRIQKHNGRKNTDPSRYITNHLTEHVHHLASRYQEATSKATWEESTYSIENKCDATAPDDSKNPDTTDIINPLTNYLKTKKYTDSSHSGVADTLISSTWYHFHAAIREARQGKKKIAEMHVDIANYAMNEAGHFLPEEEYQNFYSDIKVEIKELRKSHLPSE